MEEVIVVKGGNRLCGEIEVDTAKNAVLPIIAGCILTSKEVVLKNLPNISDVNKMLDILSLMGADIKRDEGQRVVAIKVSSLTTIEIPAGLAKEIRSSIFMLGSLLARFKKAKVTYPGGCDIGTRPIDLHLSGLRDLGVIITEDYGYIDCDASKMHSGVVHLDFPSVGATENIMMSAVLTEGQTVIMNSAKEPEIIDLANFINSLGGKIRGAGTSTIIIDGVAELGGGEYTPIPDRIITGTYLIAGAMTKGNIKLTNANYQDVYALLNKLRNAGAKIDYDNNSISLSCDKRPLACASIETQPFPGFPTDLQAQILALQTISDGISIITENLFETRFKHVPELLKMGAKITIKDRMAIVRGVQTLRGVEVFAGDLRGGASLVLAGLVADGITKVYNPHFIDRGYEDFEYKLRSLGANIKREMR